MTFVITFLAKYSTGGAEDLDICYFEGTKEEVVEMVGNLNYHRSWDEIKHNDSCDGMFRYEQLPTLSDENAIRECKNSVVKGFFR